MSVPWDEITDHNLYGPGPVLKARRDLVTGVQCCGSLVLEQTKNLAWATVDIEIVFDSSAWTGR